VWRRRPGRCLDHAGLRLSNPIRPDVVNPDRHVTIRQARQGEADLAAGVIIAARRAAVPAIPPLVHTESEVRAWFDQVVMASQEVWVAEVDSMIRGVLVLAPGWVEQLYVDPDWTGRGLGAALLRHAQDRAPGPLELWTFAANLGAKRFYRRHGFVEVGRTDGDNEEGAPDIRYRWSSPDA